MFHSSDLIFVKQCFLLTSFGSWFWCYLRSFSFLCLQLVTLYVVSGSYLGILFNPDNEFPRNHNVTLFSARKNIKITVDNSCACNSECLFMHANERRYYHAEFVEKAYSYTVNVLQKLLDTHFNGTGYLLCKCRKIPYSICHFHGIFYKNCRGN